MLREHINATQQLLNQLDAAGDPPEDPPPPPPAAVGYFAEPTAGGWFNADKAGRPTRAEGQLAALHSASCI